MLDVRHSYQLATFTTAAWFMTALAIDINPEARAAGDAITNARPAILFLDPPEQGFFSKRLDFHGILIKAPAVVADEALFAAYDHLSRMLAHLPMAVSNLAAAGAELHVIGRDQVTTDLPEWRQDKGKPLAEYHGLTRDERTRGMGGLLTSCGEENSSRIPIAKITRHGRRLL